MRIALVLLIGSSLFGHAQAGRQADEPNQYLPLELTNIRSDTASSNRVTRAYPGMEYNVRAAVVGGVYPYSFSIQNAAPGMSIGGSTGEISWANPQADASPTINVVDSAGARVSATWSIRVTSQGFRFVDAKVGRPARDNGCQQGCGTGSVDNPWRSVSDVYHSGAAGEFVYFRDGVYGLDGMPRSRPGNPWERVEISGQQRPVVWMAQPGHKPVLDFKSGETAGPAPILRFAGRDLYLDGFETRNSRYIAFQFVSGSGDGPTFRRLRMHSHGPGIDGANAAFIMTTTHPEPTNYAVIQDCEFSGVTGIAVTIKIYAQRKLLIEDTVHHDTPVAIELKEDVRQFTVRRSTIYNVPRTGIGGNMHEKETSGEILFNNVRAGVALDLNQNGMAGEIRVHRNTFVGRVQVRNTDAADGPFYVFTNVIVSDDSGVPGGSRVHHANVTAPQRVVLSRNLTGRPRDNIVDADGRLTPKYRHHAGIYGHEPLGRQAR